MEKQPSWSNDVIGAVVIFILFFVVLGFANHMDLSRELQETQQMLRDLQQMVQSCTGKG